MNETRLILNRASMVRVVLGSFFAANLIFLAGAVVGFAVHGELPASARPTGAELDAAPVSASASPVTPAVAGDGDERGSTPLVVPPPRANPAPLPEARVASNGATDAGGLRPAPDEAVRTTLYVVQFGAFRSGENARSLQADVDGRGYETIIVRARNESGQWLHHVQLAERAKTRSEAMTVAARFASLESLVAAAVPARESSEQ